MLRNQTGLSLFVNQNQVPRTRNRLEIAERENRSYVPSTTPPPCRP